MRLNTKDKKDLADLTTESFNEGQRAYAKSLEVVLKGEKKKGAETIRINLMLEIIKQLLDFGVNASNHFNEVHKIVKYN